MTAGFRVGLDVWQHACTVAELREAWTAADQGGIDNLWVYDHFRAILVDDEATTPSYEGWTLLAAMAERTSRARIGVMVTGNTYRHPLVVHKMAVTVDHLSGGRLELGLGASHDPPEHLMFGLDLPDPPERVDRLREAIVYMKALWREERADLEGTWYRLRRAVSAPAPVQRPHPPIWIGGEGERRTLPLVADHADVWNAIGRADLATYARKLRLLDDLCEARGRDPATVRRSVQVHLDRIADVDACTRRIDELRATGFDDAVVIVPPPDPMPRVEALLTTILPRVRP